MDDFFSLFVKAFGQPTSREMVPEIVASKHEGILPDSLISFWREFGWCSFRNGLIWITDPGKFSEKSKDWVVEIPQLRNGDYYVFARSAFGTLYAWRPDTARIIRIACSQGYILADKNSHMPVANKSIKIQSFFATASPAGFDLLDAKELPLFGRALKNLGALQNNELYGFEPLLVAGGQPRIENLKRLRMDVHLDLLKQFTSPVLRLI